MLDGVEGVTLLTVDEAAEQLRVHPVTVRRMIRRGDLAAVRIGSVYRVDADELKPRRVAPPARASRPADPSKLMRYARPEWRHQH